MLKNTGHEEISLSSLSSSDYSPVSYTHLDVYKRQQEEREQINFQVDLIGKVIEARESQGLSQRDLAELSGIKQPAIARMESMKSIPKIDTLFKILAPLGYTISITPVSYTHLDVYQRQI